MRSGRPATGPPPGGQAGAHAQMCAVLTAPVAQFARCALLTRLPSVTGMRTKQTPRSRPLARWYDAHLVGTDVHRRYVDAPAGRIHVLEVGEGPPLVLVHGTGVAAGFFLPLLRELHGVHRLALDLPGNGMSDPVAPTSTDYREAAVAWLDQALDALGLETTALLGHSAGGLWALWYALARPQRVTQLVLLGPPALPGTRCPLPYRVIATPGLGGLVERLVPVTRDSALRFAQFLGEGDTLRAHPELLDLFVAASNDPETQARTRAEVRYLVSPLGLLTRSGFRKATRIRPEELRHVDARTLLVWGTHEPLGSTRVAEQVAAMVPHGHLAVVPGGHGPWLGEPVRTAEPIVHFVRGGATSQGRPGSHRPSAG